MGVVHEWANRRATERERLYAIALVCSFELGDVEDPPPPPRMDPGLAAAIREDFDRVVADHAVPRGRFRGRRGPHERPY
jgi:hypothetical protein